jgi:hypothetical protein
MLNVVRHRLAFAFPYPKELIEPVIRLPKWRGKGVYDSSAVTGWSKSGKRQWHLLGAGAAGEPGAILAPLCEKQKDPAGPRPGLSNASYDH